MQTFIDKGRYLKFLENTEIHVFATPWWLDAITDGNWNAILVEKDGMVVAVMPFHVKFFFGIKYIGMPQLTQKMGPILFVPSNIGEDKRISFEIKVFKNIIRAIPKVEYFNQNFDHSIKNWLPFYWAGYRQTTRYTYIIDNIAKNENVVGNMAYSKRKQIKKAEESLILGFDLSAVEFYVHLKKTLANKKQKVSYSYQTFEKIYKAAYQNESGRSIYVSTKNGTILATLFVIWDRDCAYCLISSIDSESNTFGASSFLFKETIIFCSKFCNRFDFEGSMSEAIEHSFRQFGGVQTPYFSIKKYSKLTHILKLIG